LKFGRRGLLEYNRLNAIDWRWPSLDGSMTKAPLGGGVKEGVCGTRDHNSLRLAWPRRFREWYDRRVEGKPLNREPVQWNT